MSLISFTPLQDGATGVNAAATNNPLNTIYNDYNGNITDANIAPTAAIATSKLALSGGFVTYSPTVNGWASTTVANIYYLQIGKLVILQIDYEGTSNSSATTFTLPVTASSNVANYEGNIGLAVDNGGVEPTSRWSITPASNPNLLICYATPAGGSWTNTGTKQLRIANVIYQAA